MSGAIKCYTCSDCGDPYIGNPSQLLSCQTGVDSCLKTQSNALGTETSEYSF